MLLILLLAPVMPALGTIIVFLITLVVVIGLSIFILRNIQIDTVLKNVVLAVEGLIFLYWFLQIIGVL